MLKEITLKSVTELIERYPKLKECEQSLIEAVRAICLSYKNGGKVIIAGNGGSAADSEHIVGELMKGFLLKRPLGEDMRELFSKFAPESTEYLMKNLQGALPALSLVNQISLGTAFANDQAPDLVFAQQILGLGKKEDIFIGITTSGNSANILYALDVARSLGLTSIALTGSSGGKITANKLADIIIKVPSRKTYKIQEYHLPIYHMLCIAAEREFFTK